MIIKNDPIEFESYLTDASNYPGKAEQLIIPEDTSELNEIIQLANAKSQAITFSGARTGLTGSAIPTEGIILSLEKINNIEIKNDEVVCGPGVIHKDLDEFLKEQGRFLPPNPTETSSSIGGNVATNASGSRTFKYGATREWVESLEIILADGDEIELNRNENYYSSNKELTLKTRSGNKINIPISDIGMPNIKHAAGYYLKDNMHPIDLFIGSEGTLGLLKSITLRTKKIAQELIGLIIYFDKIDDLLDIVYETRERSRNENDIIDARLIEFFDKNSLDVLRKHYSNVPISEGALWIEQECVTRNVDTVLSEWYDIIKSFNVRDENIWVAQNDKEHREFAAFRHKLPEEVYENLADSGRQKIGTDCAVKDQDFREYYKWMYKELEELDIPFLVFGHIGNSHLHANIFYSSDTEMVKAKEFYLRLIKRTIHLGGTVSAEHGIGKIKREYLNEMFKDEGIIAMKKIKDKLDPNMIFGKGNLFL